MTQGKRVELSAAQKTDVWCRWKAGKSLHAIGRAFGKPHTSIHRLLAHRGGIVPAVRRGALLALTLTEREEISRGIASGSSIRDIARRLERAASTVSREVARRGGRPGYRAHEADCQAWELALRPKRCLLAIHAKLQKIVAGKLIWDWSPEQVFGWLKVSRRREYARVPRNDLPQAIHPSTRSAEKRAAWASAIAAPHKPLAALSRRRTGQELLQFPG
jgi:IS30 family transposase